MVNAYGEKKKAEPDLPCGNNLFYLFAEGVNS